MSNNYRKYDTEEFDVDTGTYIEDVHSNDFIGIDKDGNGLIDNVEKLVENADAQAKEYNLAQERLRQKRLERKKDNDEEQKDEEKFDFVIS